MLEPYWGTLALGCFCRDKGGKFLKKLWYCVGESV